MYRIPCFVCLIAGAAATFGGGWSQSAPVVLEQVQVLQDSLIEAVGSVVSPDGRHLYLAGNESDNIIIYSRDLLTGELVAIGEVRERVDGLDGIGGIRSLAISPDGLYVYGASFFDDALTVFARDRYAGMLTLLDVERDGIQGVHGLRRLWHVAVSPDGNHIYTASTRDDAVAVFQRDTTTGAVHFVEAIREGEAGITGLHQVRAIAVSPDGNNVYTGSDRGNAVVVFRRNKQTGVLSFVRFIRTRPDGVRALDGVRSIAVSRDGRHVYAAVMADDELAIFSRDHLTGDLAFVDFVRDGAGDIDGLNGVRSVQVSADGKHVYAAASTSAVSVFRRDSDTGLLSFLEVQQNGVNGVEGLGGAYTLTLSPGGHHVYVSSTSESALTVFSRDADSGGLAPVEVVRTGANPVDGIYSAYSVAVAPDGAHVYVSGHRDSAISLFLRETGSGKLSYLSSIRDDTDGVDGINCVEALAISNDGKNLYATGIGDSALAVFKREPTTGDLSFVEVVREGENGVKEMRRPVGVCVSPDGRFVYAAGASSSTGDGALILFSRDASTGALTYVDVVRNGQNGLDHIRVVRAIAISQDGAYLYAASMLDHGISVFARDVASGRLTFIEFLEDGVGNVDGLRRAVSMALSPNQRHVYVAGYDDNALAMFERDQNTGVLTFLGVVRDGENGVNGLEGITAVRLSPDGRFLFTGSNGDDAVAVFAREHSTGDLTYLGVLLNGSKGIRGLNGTAWLDVSPDAAHVYVAALSESAVSAVSSRLRGALSGYVRESSNGLGISRSVVELSTPERDIVETAVTDLNGYYVFVDVPTGIYDVRVVSPGMIDAVLTGLELNANQAKSQDFLLISDTSASAIVGIVSEVSSDLPLVSVMVEVIADGQPVHSTYTCADGSFAIEIPDDKGVLEVDLHFLLENYVTSVRGVDVSGVGPIEVNQSMTRISEGVGSIEGGVFIQSGENGSTSVPNAQVTITGGNGFVTTRTDSAGAFIIGGLIDDTYTIRASTPGRIGATDQRFLSGGAAIQTAIYLDEKPLTAAEDINADGVVDSADIQSVINGALGIGNQEDDSDANGDGKVNALDVQHVVNTILGV